MRRAAFGEGPGMIAQYAVAAGGAVFLTLGLLHLRLTLSDLKAPRFFAPANAALLEDLKNTRINLRKDVKNFWLSYLGFHFSHSAGLIFYGLVAGYCALARPDILSDMAARIGLVAFGASYVLMARAFWFAIPVIGSLIGVTLIAVGMAVMQG